jgi:hypothetical protein
LGSFGGQSGATNAVHGLSHLEHGVEVVVRHFVPGGSQYGSIVTRLGMVTHIRLLRIVGVA